MLINNPKIGTDPELFLFSNEENRFIVACNKIGGDKHNPIPFSNVEGFAYQEDNVACEFTIPPANNLEEWLDNINYAKNYIKDVLLKPLKLEPKYVSSTRFTVEDLDSPEAQYMGCDKSFNAYTFKQHEVDRSDYTLRTTGFHVHVGYDNSDPDISLELVRAMDLFLGVPSIFLDTDDERRKMYGKAGDWRLKSYGPEYRTLGGYFLSNDDTLTWVYNKTMKAINFINSGQTVNKKLCDDIVKVINTCDRELGMKIVSEFNLITNLTTI